jgi:hypothetical protein
VWASHLSLACFMLFHPTLFLLITLLLPSEEYKLWWFSLCTFLKERFSFRFTKWMLRKWQLCFSFMAVTTVTIILLRPRTQFPVRWETKPC